MSNKKEILMESIDILIAERLKTLKFNCWEYCLYYDSK